MLRLISLRRKELASYVTFVHLLSIDTINNDTDDVLKRRARRAHPGARAI